MPRGAPSLAALSSRQALLLVVFDSSVSAGTDVQEMCVAVVLNRPTANVVQFHTPDRPRRHICFGGEAKLRSGVAGLEVDSNGLLWLHHKPGLGGAEVGSSGIYRVAGADAAALVKAEEAELRDFLVVAGVLAMPRQELLGRIAHDHLQPVPDGRSLYPQLWALADAPDGVQEPQEPELSDGTALWWAAAQPQAADGDGLKMPPASQLADETLAEWLKFFAGHKVGDDDGDE